MDWEIIRAWGDKQTQKLNRLDVRITSVEQEFTASEDRAIYIDDDYGNQCWPVILDGPFTKAEIDNMYLKDERDANEIMKKYGTIYNLRLKENNVLFGVINIILWYCIFFGVPYLIYHTFYEKSVK